MKIILKDKFGVEREIIFEKLIHKKENYLALEIRVNNGFECYFDLDIDELEKTLTILKNQKNG